jgi:DNA-binding response OmpR family regulator
VGSVERVSTTVLLADRETASRGFLERHLRHDGFEVVASAGAAADRQARPDVVLAGDDASFERWCGEAAVIVLGRPEAEPRDRVRAFRRGCDDYVPRPFHYDELVERIRAVLRRVGPAPPAPVVAGPIALDLRTRVVTVSGAPVVLSQKEFALLARLASDPERVFTKDELLRDVWGYRGYARSRTLDSHACRLRRKLCPAGTTEELVENVWGVGYRLLGLLPAAERGR